MGLRVASLATPALPQRTLPAVWARGMAKDNKPRFARPQNPVQKPTPSEAPTPAAPRAKQPAAAAAASEAAQSQTQPQTQTPETSAESQKPETLEEQEPIPDLSKLPDLTQGIPSTLEYERAGASRESLSAIEDAEAETSTSGGSGRAKGELPASAYISSADRRRAMWMKYLLLATGLSVVGGTAYLGRDWEEDELASHPDAPNGWGLMLWWNRATARLGETKSYYQDPAFQKLLPDPDPSFARPYTLCISLEDMLVHSEWTRDHGWRMAKRPGVDYFLHYLSQYYEIVLFTSVPLAIAEPVLRKLDPYHFVMWPLGREATKYKDGEIVKDLSYLNRDLSKVIIIDTNAQHVSAQPENAIVLPKWTGDAKDTKLVSLIPFLEFIHTMDYSDVRKVIKSFEGTDIPTEFARREAIARAEHQKRLAAMRGKAKPSGGGMSWLSGMLGLKPANMSLMVPPEGEENPAEALASGKMLQDIARERGIRNYKMIEEEIRKNGEKWLKEDQEMMEKAQKEAMKSMQSSFTGWFKSEETPAPAPSSNTTPEKSA
ncbi:HAD-like domain-containing protein [Cercophora newfieldiana]|uniref:Mitochondrial import inner membrane translocase subunit TIM50 n=1 Tax=Cercophora newfieldiana TaxID=92897 RepID=A0AA39YSY8_9PEZI|nr:HAD-like domain-containing protein [Cercophora newfieldiana]